MSYKSLAESAAEILQASMMAGKEPLQPMAVQDLGGQTPENRDAGSVGSNAAAAVKMAPKPGLEGAPAEPPKVKAKVPTVADEADMAEGNKEAEDVKESLQTTSQESSGDISNMENKEVAALEEQETQETAEVEAAASDVETTVEESAETEEEVVAESMDEEDDEEENMEEAKKAHMKGMVAKHKGSMKEDVDALFNGESLSEDFRVKATLIFEAAVNSRVEKIVEDVLAENDEILAASVEEIKAELTEQVDEYLNYVVEQWVQDNQVAIETGLRAELTEDFINGLKNLFAEHYIEIPEEKVDVAEELAAEVVAMQEAAAAKDAAIAALTEEVNAVKKEKAIRLACEGLTEVQAGKMKSLAESVEFTAEGDFANKLAVIRENYFPTKVNVTSEVKEIQKTTVAEEPEVEQVNGIMKHYVNALSKTAPKA